MVAIITVLHLSTRSTLSSSSANQPISTGQKHQSCPNFTQKKAGI
jgi:hypothetical protein